MSAHQTKPHFIHGQPNMGLPFQKELVVDLFTGGGGVSTGIGPARGKPGSLIVDQAGLRSENEAAPDIRLRFQQEMYMSRVSKVVLAAGYKVGFGGLGEMD